MSKFSEKLSNKKCMLEKGVLLKKEDLYFQRTLFEKIIKFREFENMVLYFYT